MSRFNETFDRRSVLKGVGAVGAAGIASGGFAGVASADDSVLGMDAEELGRQDATDAFKSALATESGTDIREFLVEKRASLEPSGLQGYAVDPAADVPRHNVLTVPVQSGTGDDGLLSVRLFDDTASATALLGNQSYRSNPGIRKELDEDVVSVDRWVTYKRNHVETQDVSAQISVGLDECLQADPHDDCYILGGIAFLGAVTLVVIPEPSSSAAGAAYTGAVAAETLVGGSAGACAFTKIIDEHIATWCNYSAIELCLDWSTSIGWSGVSFDLEITAGPVNC